MVGTLILQWIRGTKSGDRSVETTRTLKIIEVGVEDVPGGSLVCPCYVGPLDVVVPSEWSGFEEPKTRVGRR